MARLIPLAPVRARAALRLLLTGVAVAAVTVLTACGDDEASSSSSKADNAKLASITALTPSQYTAIKKVYVAGLPLDDLEDPSLPSLSRAVETVLEACEQLDDDDLLLRELKEGCPVAAEFLDTVGSTADCSDADACADAFEAAEKGAQRVVTASRESDKAVNATRLPQGCKKALLASPESYKQAAALQRGLSRMRKAIESESQEDLADAVGLLQAADEL